jgi:hypothetical protein
MFDVETTKIVRKTRKKNIGGFLAMLFCTLVIVSTVGNSLIRNSYAQQELQTQQPSTLSESPWSNNLQALCGHGVCDQPSGSSGSSNMPVSDTGNIRHHDPTIDSSKTFTNSKQLDLNHAFVSNKVVGPDRFRFISSYWTTPDTPNGVDTGTSADNTFLAANSLDPNPKLEVDTNEGYSTLAVVLQYEGVVDLAGVTAALKLPAGFKATLPLTSDRNNYDIALSDYRGHIYPSQGIVLYFSMYILPNAKVQVPVLGPLALHFLRSNERSISDSLDASQQNILAKALSVTNKTSFPNSTNFNDNFDFKRDYFNQFGRLIPYDFVNQVIPVIFKVTGQETLDVVTLPTAGKDAVKNISTNIVTIPNGETTLVRLAVRNTGDVPIYDLTANVFPGLQSSLGINGLNPAAITSPNIPQTLFSTILPIGIVGPSSFAIGELPPNTNKEFDVGVFPTHYVAGTVELMNVNLVYNNIIGERATQLNQVYFNVLPNP